MISHFKAQNLIEYMGHKFIKITNSQSPEENYVCKICNSYVCISYAGTVRLIYVNEIFTHGLTFYYSNKDLNLTCEMSQIKNLLE